MLLVISNNGRQHAAAVCRAAGEPLAIEEIVVDPPRAYEIRIKIVCTTLCHTDITFWQAKVKWCPMPGGRMQFMCKY
jgi:Zn-dependent alcohol dehydrogenase